MSGNSFGSFIKARATTLLLIDVQKDFHPGGSLAIATANRDAERIAALIETNLTKINRIVATLDSHHKLHVAHPCFWLSGDGDEHPAPFTIITTQDIVDGKWKPREDLVLGRDHQLDPSVFDGANEMINQDGSFDLFKYCIEYTKRLEAAGRFQLCIWPEHCLIGSEGHAIVDSVQLALQKWSATTGRCVEFVHKGQHLLTEMYSAVQADVPVSKETDLNQTLLESLVDSNSNSRLLVAGQAMSHCVNYTLRDIVKHCPTACASRITLLTDCASAVAGFEDAANQFQEDMRKAGVQLKASTQVDI
jgi:nicotinamidase-related amidase